MLRVLESGEFIKIGETRPTKVDLRIIAATNRDLEKEIAAGNFREDLFFRLSVFRIQICRRSTDAKRTSRSTPAISRNSSRPRWGSGSRKSTTPISPRWNATRGAATSANCATSWNGA
ncbi:MAG: sigma 54-interacting transcriptional regulator [Alistipes finegoldii]